MDNAGNRLTRTQLPTGTASTFGYDNTYELLFVTQGGSTTESYTYDPVGNRLTDLGSSSWSYNTSNELTARPSATYTFEPRWQHAHAGQFLGDNDLLLGLREPPDECDVARQRRHGHVQIRSDG